MIYDYNQAAFLDGIMVFSMATLCSRARLAVLPCEVHSRDCWGKVPPCGMCPVLGCYSHSELPAVSPL